MKVLKALLEERDKKTGELEQLTKGVEERVTAWKALSEEGRGDEPGLTSEEETRSQALIVECDEVDERIVEEKGREEKRRLISEARSLVVPAAADAQVVSEPMVYGVRDDGVGSPHSFYGDLARRVYAQFTGADGGATQRLAEWAHQNERETANGSTRGRAIEMQLRELNREFGAVEAPKRMAELRDRGRVALEQKTAELEMRTGIGTGGGATASASGGGGAAFVTPVFDVGSYAPYRELGRPFIDQCYKQPLPDAEAMYREAQRFPRPGQPAFQAVMDGRLGMLRLRQGDLEGGERLLRNAEPALRGKDEPLIEIIPVLYARAFGEDVRGRYAEAVRLMSEALDLVTRKQAAFMEPDDLALQLAAYEALAGNRSALTRLRDVEGRLASGTVAPVDRIRHHLSAGIVEARCGSRISAEHHLRTALATQEKEMSRDRK